MIFIPMKFKVGGVDEGKRIQKHLYSLGYTWGYPGFDKDFDYKFKYLFTGKEGYITHSESHNYFAACDIPEMIVEEQVSLVLKPIKEKIFILDKTYYLEDVVNALQNIEVIK